MTDTTEIVKELAAAGTVQEVMAVAEKAGHPLDFEQADQFFGRIEQAKSDVAEIDGDSVAKVAKEFLDI
ncbi:hypothetical protein H7U32_02705 [Bifidobacterium pullorum subsp. saeculare]|uniref:Nif11 domain-containing protein n=1 Tax=Bifidobacterium pullorum subsp. saeculare TaxID=78257 RepID=A0A938WX67_9BIFI|nr:hypothetical protein [Bifidobacterium pullorum]MBM6699253.1 hypothetical protein [Bifidobacterium pullorum subsp. saeculare]